MTLDPSTSQVSSARMYLVPRMMEEEEEEAAGPRSVCDIGFADDGDDRRRRSFRWRLEVPLPVLSEDLAVAGGREVEDSANASSSIGATCVAGK